MSGPIYICFIALDDTNAISLSFVCILWQTNKCKIYLCYYGSKSVILFSFLAANHRYFLARKCKQKRNANAANGLQTCNPVTLPYGNPFLFFSKRELKMKNFKICTASHNLICEIHNLFFRKSKPGK